ncbi:IS481-like element IS1649 family transposase [Pseudonocardia petroleophila]
MELSDGTHTTTQEVLTVHANAALTPTARLRLGKLVVEQDWPVARAAERFQVSWPTAKRWADRYACEGEAGMQDRSSRPHHSPCATPAPAVRKVVHLRWKQRLGPVGIAAILGLSTSTVHRILTSCRINRLSHLDRATGEPVRRYEHPHPGDLAHVDVKKLGNIPDGGGWRFVGRAQGKRHRAATPGKPRNRHHHPKMGTGYLHTVLDDHSRVAYTEMCDDETAATAVAVLHRAVAWFAARHVTVRAVLTDNGACYRSHLWREACAELEIRHRRTRPYRPQTNGKVERFHRTLVEGWAFRRLYASETHRRKALPGWIHEYNHHRPHTACGGHPPITRLTNLSDQYN